MSWKIIVALALIPLTTISILSSVNYWNSKRPIGLRCLSSCGMKYDINANTILQCVDTCSKNNEVCK